MAKIIKLRVSTHPYTGQRFELICDYEKLSYLYKNDRETHEHFVKMSDEQIIVLNDILNRIKQLKPQDYIGPITNNGMYWEFDLVNEKNKMMEIEGVNMIDIDVIMILRDLEAAIKKPLGVQEFSQSIL